MLRATAASPPRPPPRRGDLSVSAQTMDAIRARLRTPPSNDAERAEGRG